MEILLSEIGKKYNRQWIFKNISTVLSGGVRYVIKGKNGSGKSTLLKLVTGIVLPSEGKLTYRKDSIVVTDEMMFKHISFCSPYQNLFPELTLEEHIKYHFKFKECYNKNILNEDIEVLGLKKKSKSFVRELSSGQVQRLKLILAINSISDVLALDEPLSNLDFEGIDWYKKKIAGIDDSRVLILASNNKEEFSFTHKELQIADFN
ncbi:MAG: ATP-binding cassette domain-containing protein [Bacteroidota bacterium]